MRRALARTIRGIVCGALTALAGPAQAAPPAAPSLFGAETLPAGDFAAAVGGGLALIAPSFGLDFAAGVSSRVDLAAHYDTYLGVVHAFGYETRVRLWRAGPAGPALALRGEIAYAFWVVGKVLDFATEDIPLGNGLTLQIGARLTVPVRERVRLSFDLGATVGLVSLVRVAADAHEAQGDVRLRALSLGVHAEWATREGRAFFLKFGAYVPTGGVVPLGYVPVVEIGWTFGL